MRVAVEARIRDLTPEQRAILLARAAPHGPELRRRVAGILEDVRLRGDAALREMARRWDGVTLSSLEVPSGRWRTALDRLAADVRGALERAARNVETFHRAQLPGDVELEVEPGVRVGRRALPLPRAGVYAPGGTAAYPSSVLMGVIPARVAGVAEVIVCSPPGPEGEPHPAVQAACAVAGADRLFSVGGAGAVAALTYGTDSVPGASVVVGPGNRYVAEAKRQVAADVRVDAPAGPSEVLVVADAGSARADLAAHELVAQAEHDPDAAVAFVTPSSELLEDVRRALEEQVAATPRRGVVEEALAARGGLLLAHDRGEALRFAEAYAPEHLVLLTPDPRGDLARVRSAGTVFLGEASSVAFGDYATGANHVLPTAGAARSLSGLSVLDFLRFDTWQELTPAAARALSEPVAVLAEAEGLPAHAAAARARSRL